MRFLAVLHTGQVRRHSGSYRGAISAPSSCSGPAGPAVSASPVSPQSSSCSSSWPLLSSRPHGFFSSPSAVPKGLPATQLCLPPTCLPDGCQRTLSRKACPSVEFPCLKCSFAARPPQRSCPDWSLLALPAMSLAVPILTAYTLGGTSAFPALDLRTCSPSSAAHPASHCLPLPGLNPAHLSGLSSGGTFQRHHP